MKNRIFTSESVTEGHPDKVCDRISDSVLDAILADDPNARVACESVVTTGMAFVMGEISTSTYVDIPSIVRKTLEDIGYSDPRLGFNFRNCAVLTSIGEQSADIALGVDQSFEYKSDNRADFNLIGAGDQGMMFGFACDETPELMPAPISIAHKLAYRLSQIRKNGEVDFLYPDGKSQVTVEYDEQGAVARYDTIIISAQHNEDVGLATLREAILELVIKRVVDPKLLDQNTKIFINPTGRFVVGGPQGDSGLTGRKIIVDTYGGYARHGGGAFSGKDPTKVDRSASYMGRYIAKNLVAAGLARRCEIEIAYAIGVAHPVSLHVETFGTGILPDEKLAELVLQLFDLRPAAIIQTLDLRRPIYQQTASYGHFGRTDIDLPWERLNRVEELQAICGHLPG